MKSPEIIKVAAYVMAYLHYYTANSGWIFFFFFSKLMKIICTLTKLRVCPNHLDAFEMVRYNVFCSLKVIERVFVKRNECTQRSQIC